MRKIVSEEKRSKARKRNQFLVGFVLIFLMLFSILGFAFQGSYQRGDATSGGDTFNYNGFAFEAVRGFFILDHLGFQFLFQNDPRYTSQINSELNGFSNYQGKPLYIYSENDDAELEIYRNLFQGVERIQNACLETHLDSGNCGENLPVKTCEDNFIIIEEEELEEIRQEGNCVFIGGDPNSLLRLSDSFLYKILGVS